MCVPAGCSVRRRCRINIDRPTTTLHTHQHQHTTQQETTVFCTAHCPENRYLLAASNQGRLAVWDLTSYLFPSHDQPHQHPHTYTDRPVLSPAGLGRFPRQLQPGQARLHPGALVRQGWPRLSLQVSDRAVNSIAFTPPNTTGKGGPLLVLAGDEAVFMYEWAAILALLEPDAPATGAETVAAPAPRRVLRALPAGAAKSWPYLTESNCVALGWAGGLEAYSAVRVWGLGVLFVRGGLDWMLGCIHFLHPSILHLTAYHPDNKNTHTH